MDVERGFDALSTGARRRQRAGRWNRRRECADVGLDGLIARLDLSLTGIVEFEVLLEDEDQFRTVMPGQSRLDLGRRRATAPIAMAYRRPPSSE